MKVAVLRETNPNESRVGLVPEGVKFLMKKEIQVVVEKDAGLAAGFLDPMYEAEGAVIAPDAASAVAGADIVAKILPPAVDEVGILANGHILVCSLQPSANLAVVKALKDAGVTTMALDLMPRITRAQTMDILSSQATVAGYKAVLLGANAIGKFLPMLTTAAGTIRPAKTLVLGAGVAGLQALATFRRLGARMEAFDVRPAVKEQVESLGAKFLEMELSADMEDEGGYAKELSKDQHERELELIAGSVKDADVVVTTAQIPGRKAPVLITREMVESMKPGSAIVDLAAETGGNCELTKAGETVVHNGVMVLGPVNLPASMPYHASQMFSKNLVTFVMEMRDKEGNLNLNWENEVLDGVCVTFQNEVRHGPTQEALGATS
jgi:H+-translocating NAD(P) transhydrogenase subunit alpha